jgi:signal transduction histidine kinase
MNNSLGRWLTSKYAIGWQLAAALLLNYPVTGLFFGETVTSAAGVTNHIVDLVTGIVCALAILLFSLITKIVKRSAIWLTTTYYVISSLVTMTLSTIFRIQSGFTAEAFDVLVSGTLQMIAIHFLYSIAISSLMETRSERKYLEKQRSRLEATRKNFENLISEITERLSVGVNQKLNSLLSKLQTNLNQVSQEQPKVLAELIADTLNEGVRPLSWEIENQSGADEVQVGFKTKRIGLIERLKFSTQLQRVISVRTLILLFVFFDLPVMYFYFGINAAIQTSFAIALTALLLWQLKNMAGERKLPSWLAILILAVTVAVASSMFLVYRSLTGELTADVSEIALVISMVQIATFAAIFQSALVRRYSYIEDQKAVNAQLESLVSQLRQSAWVSKKKLARLVHGQVQSELFAAYLELSQASTADSALYKEVLSRIELAKGALSQEPSDSANFEQALGQIVGTWGSSFSINTDISAPALAALKTDPVAATCALEVIREAVNNAAKYGTAGSALVSVSLRSDSRLYIEVVNPANDADSSTPGYGRNVLDEITHEWTLEITDGQAKLTAEVILNQN